VLPKPSAVLALVSAAVSATATLPAAAADGAPPVAVVALIGAAGDSSELAAVLSELLERDGVRPEIASGERFDADTLLSEGENDARVWVFVVLRGPRQARLYFRGPLGKRFLLRELSLRSGLDEVGRELIAQVVETSTVALLHSEAGMSRDEASASLARERAEPAPKPAPVPKPHAVRPRPAPSPLIAAAGARALVLWNRSSAGPAAGVGAEGGLGVTLPRSLLVRGRLAFEYRLPQTIATPRLDASFGSVALRGAVDTGIAAGRHSFWVGLGAGADFDHAGTDSARDRSLRLAPTSHSASALLRAELRYELTLGAVWLAVASFIDVSTVHTHFDVADPGGPVRLAELWVVRPGFALTVGWATPGHR
jgi:hypothetical protein